MNSKDLTESLIEKKTFKRNLLIAGIISAAFSAIVYLFKRLSGIPPKPPPIIIKSGIFVIETDGTLDETPDGISVGTTAVTKVYKRKCFGEIKGVRVIIINEASGQADSHDYEDKRGVEVDIRLQKSTLPNVWQDVEPLVTIRTMNNAKNPKDFVLEIGKKLSKKGFPSLPRKQRWEDDGTENLRFGRIVVRENDGGGDEFVYRDGDHYQIQFYN